MELPSHPDADDAEGEAGGEPAAKGWSTVALVVVIGLVLLVVVLHLTGVVGPAAR